MSVARYTEFHFSQANPKGAGQESVPELLRRVADTIDRLGDVGISDLILHPALTQDGDERPSITVYYHDRVDTQ